MEKFKRDFILDKNKLIKIYLIGGFGNVLFQINYGEFLLKRGCKVEFCDFFLKKNILTNVLKWTIHGTTKDLNNLSFYNEYKFTDYKLMEIFLIILSKLFSKSIFVVEYCGHSLPSTFKENKTICGYFMLAVPISPVLINNLRSKLLEKYSEINKDTGIVHYRGGDYSNSNDHFPNLDIYYGKALRKLGVKYHVVTNDKQLAQKVFCNDKNFLGVISSESALDDFSILISANILIQSSSTYSWWAAEISKASLVYQPEPFFSHLEWNPISSNNKRVGISYEA